MNAETLEQIYFEKYGTEFKWDNLQLIVEDLKNEVCCKQKKLCSDLYVEKTTMTNGKFVGDKRVIEMLEKAPNVK